ncbi:hypothetical protein QBC47DRAFT_376203 [Echria macrotheca]|uniref:Uncharacterized protein n=1 Tax=Echria macrotheca TaxID=438768 RepID=A0AAJ0BGD6_9PEZI|nr:hypothetical protein QBC47DRAFT_376203 [Echria macrotheca]
MPPASSTPVLFMLATVSTLALLLAHQLAVHGGLTICLLHSSPSLPSPTSCLLRPWIRPGRQWASVCLSVWLAGCLAVCLPAYQLQCPEDRCIPSSAGLSPDTFDC